MKRPMKADAPLNAFAAMLDSERAKAEALESEARLDRRALRIEQWALRRDKGELAEHYALSLLLNLELRRITERQARQLEAARGRASAFKEIAVEHSEVLTKQWMDRRRGAANMRAKHPAQSAKARAVELWPEAHRKGWTATQFHRAIVDAGHALPPDTARKWLTKLRQTGTC